MCKISTLVVKKLPKLPKLTKVAQQTVKHLNSLSDSGPVSKDDCFPSPFAASIKECNCDHVAVPELLCNLKV